MPGRVILGRSLVVTLVAWTIVLAVFVLRRLDVRPRTTDAVVTANTIQIAPEVAGRIAILNVKDDAEVRKGDVLFEIERERYELNLAQAIAQVSTLEARINLANRRVSSERSGVGVARANAEGARARLDEATRTLERLEGLLPERYVTPQQVDLPPTNKATAESQLQGAKAGTQQNPEAVGATNPLLADLQ